MATREPQVRVEPDIDKMQKALLATHEALRPLTAEERERVVKSICILLRIPLLTGCES